MATGQHSDRKTARADGVDEMTIGDRVTVTKCDSYTALVGMTGVVVKKRTEERGTWLIQPDPLPCVDGFGLKWFYELTIIGGFTLGLAR